MFVGGLGIAPFRTDPLALHLRRARAGPHLQATPPGSLTVMAVTVTVTLSHAHFGIVEAQWFCNGRARESKAPIGTGSMPLLPGQLPVGPSSPDSAGRFEPVPPRPMCPPTRAHASSRRPDGSQPLERSRGTSPRPAGCSRRRCAPSRAAPGPRGDSASSTGVPHELPPLLPPAPRCRRPRQAGRPGARPRGRRRVARPGWR